MKKIIYRYRISKFRRFTQGLLFAVISATALILCLTVVYAESDSRFLISFTFGIAIISMLLGLVSMFHKEQVPKNNCKEADY